MQHGYKELHPYIDVASQFRLEIATIYAVSDIHHQRA